MYGYDITIELMKVGEQMAICLNLMSVKCKDECDHVTRLWMTPGNDQWPTSLADTITETDSSHYLASLEQIHQPTHLHDTIVKNETIIISSMFYQTQSCLKILDLVLDSKSWVLID